MIYVLFSSTYHGELDYLALKKLRVIIYNDNQAIWEQDAAGSNPVTPTKKTGFPTRLIFMQIALNWLK